MKHKRQKAQLRLCLCVWGLVMLWSCDILIMECILLKKDGHMKPNKLQLEYACGIVREAGQQISDERQIPYFPVFPSGWCGCVSRVLGAWLCRDYPGEAFYYVCGWRGSSHAWIEYRDVVLDITADQFKDNNKKIIVTSLRDSIFHNTFQVEFKHLCSLSDIENYEERLVYRRACLIANYGEGEG